MRIALINPPHRHHGRGQDGRTAAQRIADGDGPEWVTVPPQGYGAIPWVCAHLAAGLVRMGHEIVLLGAPGSPEPPGVQVVDASTPEEFDAWAASADVDIVHDHTNGLIDPAAIGRQAAFVSTHHLTGPPRVPRNCVFVSQAQRGLGVGPVIPLPVDPGRYDYSDADDGYLLFLGRVSEHKGAYEAAALAAAAGRRLVLAGPAWEPDYLARIFDNHGDVVDAIGEIGGAARTQLLARATAVVVLSQPVIGPWGHRWCEPGATVVSEAAVSGTPVIASRNGCLPEVAAGLGAFVDDGAPLSQARASALLAGLPTAAHVRRVALVRWHHLRIARRYERLYRRLLAGSSWGTGTGH